MSESRSKPVIAKSHLLQRWWPAILICTLLISGGAIYSSTRSKVDVRIVHPTYEDIARTVSTTGIVVPVNDYPVRANFTGLIEKIEVKLGQKVRPGQMLVRMKDQYAVPRLEAARAALDDAEVNRENVLKNGSKEDRIGFAAELQRAQTEQQQAAVELDSMKRLLQRGSVSGAEMEAAEQRLDTANTNLHVLQLRMQSRYSPKDIASWKDRVEADRAQVEAERVSWANANISAPAAGTVYLLPVHPYDFVPAGTELLHVADLSRMYVRADFEEPDIANLSIGQRVIIKWEGAVDRLWHGHITSKPLAVLRSGGRAVGQCTITLDDDHGELPANTSVSIIVTTEERRHVLSVPREALYTDGNDHYVYRVVDGRLVRTSVETGLANAMRMEVVGGLRLDDAIALHATSGQPLENNLRVSVAR